MALNLSNSSNLDQLVLKVIKVKTLRSMSVCNLRARTFVCFDLHIDFGMQVFIVEYLGNWVKVKVT